MSIRWVPVYQYEKFYEVSNTGVVRSLYLRTNGGHSYKRVTPLILKQSKISHRIYASVTLTKNNKQKSFGVHRLIVLSFIGPPPSKMHVAAHMDGNPHNNNLSNLKWITYKENTSHRKVHGTNYGPSTLNESQVAIIRKKLNTGVSGRVLSKQYGVTESCISSIKRQKTWKDRGIYKCQHY